MKYKEWRRKILEKQGAELAKNGFVNFITL